MVAADIAADPNQITDPTGGAANFNILDVFQEFGYQPTQAEISALAPSFEGAYSGGQIGFSAIAQYVNYKQQLDKFNANDPLTALQTRMNTMIDQNMASVKGLSQQLQDTLTAAPKLFGSLTPDQISTYLAPLQTSFTQQMSQVQGALASRGLGASSTEANALAQTNQQFQESVLSAGLNIGLTSQKAQADALQAQINNLFGQTGQAMSISGNAAGQQSQQQLGESQLLASLPSFLNAQSAEQEQIATANNQKKGFQGTFNQVTGDISQGMNALQTIAMIPQQFKTSMPGSTPPATFQSPNSPTGAQTTGIPSSSYQAPTTNLPEYAQLFQQAGSSFGS